MGKADKIDAELEDLKKRGIVRTPPQVVNVNEPDPVPLRAGAPVPEMPSRDADVLARLEASAPPTNAKFEAPTAQYGPEPPTRGGVPVDPAAHAKWEQDRKARADYETALRTQGLDKPLFQNPFATPVAGPGRQPVSQAFNAENPEVAAAQAQQGPQGAAAGAAAAMGQPMAMPAPQYVAPHFDDRNVPIKAGTRKEILGTFDTIAKAEAMKARVAEDQAAVEAEGLANEAERAKRSMANRIDEEDKRRNVVRQQLGKLQEVTDSAQGGRIDPDQVMKAKGSWGRLAAGVGIALGAGIQAKTGGRNVALDIIDGEIARNLEVQKANLSLANQDVLRQDNLLQKYRETFGDERLAELAFENTAREVAIQQIQAEAAKRQSPMIAANAAEAIGKIRQQQLATQADFEKMAFVRGYSTGGTGAGASIKQDGNLVRLPDGRTVRFATEKEAIEARAKLTAAYNTVDMYDQAGKLRQKLDTINPVTSPVEFHKVRSELDALAERILPEWSLSHGQGQVKEEEAKRYKKNLFPFASFWDPAANGIIKQGRDKEISQIDNVVRASAGEYVDEGYGLDKNGRVVKDDSLTTQAPKGRKIAAPSGFKPFGAK